MSFTAQPAVVGRISAAHPAPCRRWQSRGNVGCTGLAAELSGLRFGVRSLPDALSLIRPTGGLCCSCRMRCAYPAYGWFVLFLPDALCLSGLRVGLCRPTGDRALL